MVLLPRVSEKLDLWRGLGVSKGRLLMCWARQEAYHHRGNIDIDNMYKATVKLTIVCDTLKSRDISDSEAVMAG